MAKSIMPANEKGRCYICDRKCPTQEHHIFGGANRKISDREGLTVYLCADCHTGNQGVHRNKELMDYMHRLGQIVYEEKHTRQEFMQLFGRNYL